MADGGHWTDAVSIVDGRRAYPPEALTLSKDHLYVYYGSHLRKVRRMPLPPAP